MPKRAENKIEKRNDAIVKRFNALINKKTSKGKSVHSYAFCIETVADEFFLSEYWIACIIRAHD